jgi:asparagine synthase (glutamine-hydrolysing)
MCGICGIATAGEQPSRELIRKMCSTIVHRGPDGEGVFVAPGVGLGMRRLAIIDLVTGDQPMANESGSVQIVFNGEIYNFQELRRDLESRGHRFATHSDTEVVPHLYEEHGPGFAEKLNGMFAIALWDAEAGRLVLARDRIGIKPLFYSVRDGTLFFGSEVKAILAAGGSRRGLDLEALDQLLTFEYTASPRSLFDDVRKLEPGSFLVWQRGNLEKKAFWELPRRDPDESASDDAWAERLKAVFNAAAKRQMVSDVPLGSFLSGGIDSSILVSAMSQTSDEPPKTFSIGFRNETYDELKFARTMAQHCGTEHREAVLEPHYLSLVDKLVHHMDQPIGDFSIFPTYLVSKIAREHVTVVLSGDGGDELFAGYDTYVADRMARRTTDLVPAGFRRALAHVAGHLRPTEDKKGLRNNLRFFLEGARLPSDWQHMRWMVFLSPAQKRELYHPDVFERVAGEAGRTIERFLDYEGRDRLQGQMFGDVRFYLAENILPKVDLMSMATSLETRVPYLDNEVVDLVARMPSRLKWRGRTRKYILKKAYAADLPRAILAREKQGFSIPLKAWLNREWNPLMRDTLSEGALRRDGWLNPATVGRWIREHEAQRANHSHILWSLMVFQLWRQRFLGPSGP